MRLQTKIFAGSLVLAAITLVIILPAANAQLASLPNTLPPVKMKVNTIVRGEGAITDSSGNLFTGHYRLGIIATGDDDSSGQYIVKHGQFIISDQNTRNKFTVSANTWTFAENQSGYTANGQVTDQQGKTYNVTLDAQMVSKFNNGCIYVANGSFSDNGTTVYQLHYVSVMVEKAPKQTTSSTTSTLT